MKNKTEWRKGFSLKRRSFFAGTTALLATFVLRSPAQRGPGLSDVVILNPYSDVDWDTVEKHKANLHSHTLRNRVMEDGSVVYGDHRTVDANGKETAGRHPDWGRRNPSRNWHPLICTMDEGTRCECCDGSDGQWYVDALIDWYHQNGYTILAITDHDKNSWPWTKWHRDSEQLGILAVRGNEASTGHHLLALFSSLGWETRFSDPGRRKLLNMIHEDGGVAVLCHPGFYAPPRRDRHMYDIKWYVDLFRNTYHVMNGIEAMNGGSVHWREWNCLWTWDRILDEMMPEMPVWGFGPDDSHHLNARNHGRSYDMFYLPELTEEALRKAIRSGHSSFSYEQDGDNHRAPRIKSVAVHAETGVIEIKTDGPAEVVWKAGGRKVASGASVNCFDLFNQREIKTHVRAEISNSHGITYTQPFGVKRVEAASVSNVH